MKEKHFHSASLCLRCAHKLEMRKSSAEMRKSMKLKYYMRGLGIGILLTTLIFIIVNQKEKLSDKEIVNRAKALGMVTKEDNGSDLHQVLKDINLTGTPAPTITVTPVPSVEAPTKSAPTPTIEPTKAPTPKVTPTKAPTNTPKPTKAPENGTISFTISSGMSSGQVASLLVKKRLIEDADDFNQYIVNKGKASIIRVGTYKISSDSTYDDIITLITTKH